MDETPPKTTPERARPHPIALGLLLASIGLAFADASIVALAIPDLRAEFDASIPEVSGVLVIYAAAVAAVGLLALTPLRRIPPSAMTAAGAALFAIASAAAGWSPSLEILLTTRAVQGAGGALLVMGAVPVLEGLVGDPARGTRLWALAGSVGAVIGPALGGLVTQLADWRAVFLIQAPVAIGAVAAAIVAPRVAAPATRTIERRARGALVADLGLLALFGALVGALFLGVIMVVTVWGIEPAVAALVVSGLPLGTLATSRLRRGTDSAAATMAGGFLLAGGLATLALIPGVAPLWALGSFVLCGMGFGLLSARLGPLAVAHDDGGRSASLSSTARHLGLVVGLVLIAPVVAADVEAAAEQAPIPATATLLDSPVDSITKVRIALDIRDELAGASTSEIPDLGAIFAEHSEQDPDVAALADDLETSLREVITRSFRTAFAISAVLALMAGMVGVAALARASSGTYSAGRARRPVALTGVALASFVTALALPAAAAAAGGSKMGSVTRGDPCAAAADPYPGSGFDASVQRIVLSGLNGAACELGTSREELILSLEPRSGFDDVQWDQATIERALRSGVDRALEDADDRDSLPGWMAWTLQKAIRHAPVSWFLEQLGVR